MSISFWVRCCARLFDYSIAFLVFGAVTLFLPYFYGAYFYLELALIVPPLWAPIEALLIARYGTTPGKFLFGLRIKEKLSFKESLCRALFFRPRPGTLVARPTSFKRKISAFAVFAACFLTAWCGNILMQWTIGMEKRITTDGWVLYSSSEQGFTVQFPTDPEQESKQFEIPNDGRKLNYEELKSYQTDKVYYSVSYMKLPSKWKWAGSSTLLKGALDIVIKHTPSATLKEKSFTTHQRYRALNFQLKQGDDEVKGRLILVGNTLYKLTIVYPPSLAAKLDESPFIDSFDITK